MFDENCPKQSFVKSFFAHALTIPPACEHKGRDGEFNRIGGCAVDHTVALHSSFALEALRFPSAQACWLRRLQHPPSLSRPHGYESRTDSAGKQYDSANNRPRWCKRAQQCVSRRVCRPVGQARLPQQSCYRVRQVHLPLTAWQRPQNR